MIPRIPMAAMSLAVTSSGMFYQAFCVIPEQNRKIDHIHQKIDFLILRNGIIPHSLDSYTSRPRSSN
jgi:hypothetical protein